MKLDNRVIILAVIAVIIAVIGYVLLAPGTPPEKPLPATTKPTQPTK